MENMKSETTLTEIIEKDTVDEEPELKETKTPDVANEDFMRLNRKDNFSATNYHDMYDNRVNPDMVI